MAIFQYEWIEQERYPDPVIHHTMAKLRIAVGDCVATEIYDNYLKEPGDHIYVPMSQIVEWLVLNWWFLWFESGSTTETTDSEFAARHDLSYAGHGFVFPALTLQPFGEGMRVCVRPWSPRFAPLRFRGECDLIISREEVERELRTLIEDVLRRLQERDTPWVDVASDWKAIGTVEPDDREFCQAAALAGFDPFNIPSASAREVERLWDGTPPALREEALYGASVSSLAAVGRWLPRQLEAVEGIESGEAWIELRKPSRRTLIAADLPWKRGYAAAQAVLAELGVPLGKSVLSLNGDLKIGGREVTSPSPRIEGCVASNSPSCVTVRKLATGRRFLKTRALGDYLTRTDVRPAVLGTRDTPRQAESRAFAAEFLAPSKWLRMRIGGAPSVDQQAVDELAYEAGVSSWVIRHQIENHGVAEVRDLHWPMRSSA